MYPTCCFGRDLEEARVDVRGTLSWTALVLGAARVPGGELGGPRARRALEDVDVAALVRDTCERFTEAATRAGSELHVIAPVPCPGRFDPQRLEQSCQDHGIGIAAEDRERVFGRFERAVSERNYSGLGLGLWIARELVTAHGGTITLESEVGCGSTFTITLPIGLPIPHAFP